jgi:hypothetical protein
MTNAEIISKCIKKSLGSNGYFITNTEPGTEIKLCGLFSKPDTSVLDQCRELKKTYQLQGSHSEEAIADSIVKAGTHYTTLLMSNSFADRQRAVETIMTTSQKSKKGHDIIQLSFATKYSAFASVNGKEMPNEDKVIIYDSYVFAFLVAAQNIFHYFDTPDKMGPKQPRLRSTTT